jgi:hypothetical protein
LPEVPVPFSNRRRKPVENRGCLHVLAETMLTILAPVVATILGLIYLWRSTVHVLDCHGENYGSAILGFLVMT